MASLPHRLYDVDAVRRIDAAAIERLGIPGLALMQRAGDAVWDEIRRHWPVAREIVVLAGAGNNAGDGYVIARLAHAAGCAVTVVQLGDTGALGADAAACLADMRAAGCSETAWEERLPPADLYVDAMLGTGVTRPVAAPYADAIRLLNARRDIPVVSVDLPSGLHGSSGAAMGTVLRADLTVTFIALKTGLLTGAGPAARGELCFASLAVPAAAFEGIAPTAERLDFDSQRALLAPRSADAHKGRFGHVLVVGGARGYGGAVRMAGEAAARAGAGLVSLATDPAHAALIPLARPELMSTGASAPADLNGPIARATVIAIGPGLGTGQWGAQLLGRVLDTQHPLVVDADALNLLAAEPLRRDNWILTPHPGEAGRLLGTSAAEIQRDRPGAARELQSRYGGVVVLKGAGTIVAGPDRMEICPYGNPGMASGGMGDVLTGVIAGLAAQHLPAPAAASLGVSLHGLAGDQAAAGGAVGLLATDLLAPLRALLG